MSTKIFGQDWYEISNKDANARVQEWIVKIKLKDTCKWDENKLLKIDLTGPPNPKYFSKKFSEKMLYQDFIYASADEFLILRLRKKESLEVVDSILRNDNTTVSADVPFYQYIVAAFFVIVFLFGLFD